MKKNSQTFKYVILILWKIPAHFLSWVHINANRVSFPSGTINRVIFKEGQRLLQDETLVLQGCQEMDEHRAQSSMMVPKPHAPSQARTTAKAGRDSNETLTPNRARGLGPQHPPPPPPTPSTTPADGAGVGCCETVAGLWFTSDQFREQCVGCFGVIFHNRVTFFYLFGSDFDSNTLFI